MFNPLNFYSAKQAACGGLPSLRGALARRARAPLHFAIFLLAALCGSCGSVAVDPPPPVSVSVVPGSAQPYAGAKVQFSAIVQNAPSSAVNWQVNTIPGGNTSVGTIDSSGMYKAPATVPSQSTVTVTAVLQMDSTKAASSSVTIQPDSSLSISPALASFTPSQSWQFQVSTPGFSNGDAAWAVDGVAAANTNATTGTISSTGLYTAPGSPGLHVITAKLTANPSVGGSAVAYVTDFPGTLTWRNDNARSGVNKYEMALSPATVNSSTFGKLFSCPIDGYAYAQPLYVPNLVMGDGKTHNVIFVATEKDSVFAFDADANPCLQLWSTTNLIPDGSQAISNANMDIAPFMGITGTPVIGLSTPTPYLYVVAATQTSGVNPTYNHWLYALSLTTGHPEILPSGVKIATPDSVFNSSQENQRPALLLDNGTVYIGFGSNGLPGDYRGWLLAYNAATLAQTGAFNVAPSLAQGGIWQSGGGPSADSNHNVYVLTGDGPFSTSGGVPSYGNSALRLNTSGGLSVADYFSPCNNTGLGSMDFGASAPLLVDPAGPASEPHFLLGASKDGSLYVMNRDSLGGFNPSCSADSLPRVQIVPVTDGPILSTPVFWNNTVFVAAGNGKLKAFPLQVQGGVLASSTAFPIAGKFRSAGRHARHFLQRFGQRHQRRDSLADRFQRRARQSRPTPPRFSAPSIRIIFRMKFTTAQWTARDAAGLAVKFTVPTVANGKVYVGTQTRTRCVRPAALTIRRSDPFTHIPS